jgi:hypothetical protein
MRSDTIGSVSQRILRSPLPPPPALPVDPVPAVADRMSIGQQRQRQSGTVLQNWFGEGGRKCEFGRRVVGSAFAFDDKPPKLGGLG